MPAPALGSVLRALREKRGLSLRELGQLAEVDHAYIHRLETGSLDHVGPMPRLRCQQPGEFRRRGFRRRLLFQFSLLFALGLGLLFFLAGQFALAFLEGLAGTHTISRFLREERAPRGRAGQGPAWWAATR